MMMSSNEVDHTKVPIWVGKDCKIVTGINKSTTCQHVIQSLITDNPSKFVIVEKWKKMERRLDASVRILKVWKAWGDQKDDVTLILRPNHANDGYIDKRISNKVPRRNKTSQLHKLTNHEDKMEEGGEEVREPMERLLKLILTQGETIQAQLKKLRHQEDQIERYEEEMHRIRSLKEGDNYVVESYLRDDKGKKLKRRDKSPRKSGWLKQHHHGLFTTNHHHHHHHRQNHSREKNKDGEKEKIVDVCQSSGTATVQMRQCETTTTTDDTKCSSGGDGFGCSGEDDEYIREQSELMERICELNSKLTKEEETLVKLGLKIKKFYERHKDDQQVPVQIQMESSIAYNNTNLDNEGSNQVDDKLDDDQQDDNYEDYDKEDGGDEEKKKIKKRSSSNNNCNNMSHEQEQEWKQLIGQVEKLRENTNEQFTEIAFNEKSLNELEQVLDLKHDHVAHLTYQIQQVDEESECLRQRLLKISQGFPPRPYPSSHHYNLQLPSSSPGISSSSSSSLHPHPQVSISSSQQQLQQPIILLESPPQQQQVATAKSSSSSSEEMESQPQIISTQQIIPCDSSAISSINFPCSHSPSSDANMASNTQLNLHIKPCRDHQDNDSNSDTGISSLHSSSDENTLFVLDTLV